MPASYDIIGDVHGMRRTLDALLERLGYSREGARWTHPEGRRLVFLGDLLDRGPDPLGCLELAAELVDQGRALMCLGNHELNVLHYMEDPPLRPHTQKNARQAATTLQQIEAAPRRWDHARGFLLRCSTRLELDGGRLRVIHACWDAETVESLPPRVDTPELLRRTAAEGDLLRAVERCLKGPEEPCELFHDKDGIPRTTRRVPWWTDHDPGAPLTVFGHYWFPWRGEGRRHTPEQPSLLGPASNAACLDYSAGKGGPMVALRYPERELVTVPCRDRAGPGGS